MSREKSRNKVPFGQELRAKRLGKKITLRKFAELVGVSPTYLSQVEQCNVDPPTAERVRRMAELLGENVDAWSALAGRIPDDLQQIIQSQSDTIPDLLRAVNGLTAKQLQSLIDTAIKMKRGT
jgi:transcriptional regulator with XRE-family HTH domain